MRTSGESSHGETGLGPEALILDHCKNYLSDDERDGLARLVDRHDYGKAIATVFELFERNELEMPDWLRDEIARSQKQPRAG